MLEVASFLAVNIQTILVFFLVFLVCVLFLSTRKPANYPPGPTIFPVVGTLPAIKATKKGQQPYELINEIYKKYGEVVYLKLGAHPSILVSGYDAVKECLLTKGDLFANRPDNMYIWKNILKQRGILANGPRVKTMRRFAVVALRDFGVGKRTLEERITEEARAVRDVFSQHEGQPFDCVMLMVNAVSNIICSIAFGERFEYTDADFRAMLDHLQALFRDGDLTSPLNFFPWLRFGPKFLPFFAKLQVMLDSLDAMVSFVKTRVEDHRHGFDPNNIRDFVDLYLEYQQKTDTDETDKESKLSEEDLFYLIVQLFGAGTETTSTTLNWTLLYMITWPEIQQRVHQEIDAVIGGSRAPSLKDKTAMPYTNAVLHEVQRLTNIVPINIPRSNTCDTELCGHFIPKGTIVSVNLYSVNMDPKYWEQPEQFKPERWLDGNGDFVKREAFMPFGAGRRACLGEQLAKMELFLFFTTLMQQFTFKMAEGTEHPGIKGNQGITLMPPTYKFTCTRR